MPRFEGVWMINRTLNKVPHLVPPAAIKSFEARGWEQTDLPASLDSDDPEFVEALESLLADDDEPESEDVAPATEPKEEE